MRLLLTADPIGGVWTFALELIRSLTRYGVEIALATQQLAAKNASPAPAGRRERGEAP